MLPEVVAVLGSLEISLNFQFFNHIICGLLSCNNCSHTIIKKKKIENPMMSLQGPSQNALSAKFSSSLKENISVFRYLNSSKAMEFCMLSFIRHWKKKEYLVSKSGR